ncbi:MAG TPA: hypothetical protein VIK58_10625, partial [Caldimonas sp.]
SCMALDDDSNAQGDDEHAQGTLSDPEPSSSPTPVAADPPSFAESFAAAEQAALGFLVEEHGFRRDEREVGRAGIDRGVFGRVVYRSPASAKGHSREVTLKIAPLRLELVLELSRTGSPPCRIEELHDLESRRAFPRREHGLYDAMHEPEQLQAEFMRLAGVLRACGERFFDDDPYLWEDLGAKRMRRAQDNAVRRTLAQSRERFRARDWAQVIDLLAPIEHRLGRNATARLAYAKQKARQGA